MNSWLFVGIVGAVGGAAVSCSTSATGSSSQSAQLAAPAASATAAPTGAAGSAASAQLPAYLQRMAHADLYARAGGKIVDAPAADLAVLQGYVAWANKGPLQEPSGQRLTIMTAKTHYTVGEEVRVIHVHEATKPGVELYIMGPKTAYGEFVDGVLAGPAASTDTSYDGAVVPSPAIDHNYEVSVHKLAAGTHTLQWKTVTMSSPAQLISNELVVDVR